jgi:ribosomal protein S18 acetylase RimI-like enzyme
MFFREASEADFGRMLDVQLASIAMLTDTYSKQELEKWKSVLITEGGKRFAEMNSIVCEGDEKMMGFVSWVIDDNLAKIRCLYVLPEFVRRGIGSELLKQTEKEISKGGGLPIRVKASLNARAFYERYGYKFIEPGKSRAGFDVAMMEKS